MLRDADEGIGVPVVKALDMRIEYESRTLFRRAREGFGEHHADNLEVTRAFAREYLEGLSLSEAVRSGLLRSESVFRYIFCYLLVFHHF